MTELTIALMTELTIAQQMLIGATAAGVFGLLSGILAADFFRPRKSQE